MTNRKAVPTRVGWEPPSSSVSVGELAAWIGVEPGYFSIWCYRYMKRHPGSGRQHQLEYATALALKAYWDMGESFGGYPVPFEGVERVVEEAIREYEGGSFYLVRSGVGELRTVVSAEEVLDERGDEVFWTVRVEAFDESGGVRWR